MKKIIVLFVIIVAFIMSFPISAVETRRIGDREDEISALEDDIIRQMNKLIIAENSEQRYTKRSIELIKSEDISDLEMYKLHIIPGELTVSNMTATEFNKLISESNYEWIIRADVGNGLNVTAHIARYNGADSDHLAMLIRENVITDKEAKEFVAKQGDWHVYSLALSDSDNPAFDAINEMRLGTASADQGSLYVLSLQSYAMAATAYTVGDKVMIRPLEGNSITSTGRTYQMEALNTKDTDEYMPLSEFVDRYHTYNAIQNQRMDEIGALPAILQTEHKGYVPTILITTGVIGLVAVLILWCKCFRCVGNK